MHLPRQFPSTSAKKPVMHSVHSLVLFSAVVYPAAHVHPPSLLQLPWTQLHSKRLDKKTMEPHCLETCLRRGTFPSRSVRRRRAYSLPGTLL